ncbi:MAG: tetratricopeptide repeat protein [Bacillota bacterium]
MLEQNIGVGGFYKSLAKIYYYGLSAFYNISGNKKDSLSSLEKLMDLDPSNPEIHWKIGINHLRTQNFNLALKHLESAVSKGSNNPKYLLWLSSAQNSLGNHQESLQIIEDVVKQKPDSHEAWFLQGQINLNCGELNKAVECFEKAVMFNTQNLSYWNELGFTYISLRQPIKALESFFNGLKINSKDSTILFNIGLVYIKLEKFEESLKYLEKAKKYKLMTTELFNALGLCYSYQGNTSKAEENYLKVLSICPDNIEAICNLAAIKGKKSFYNDAIALYESLISINKYDGTILNNIAWCLENIKNWEQAINYYYRALALEPQNSSFRLNLCECLIGRGYLIEAINHLEQLIKIDPVNSKAWQLLGKIYDSCKLHAKAIDCYNKALGLE